MGKRIAFVGAGALGGYVGGYLAHHGQDVTLIDMCKPEIGPDEQELIKTVEAPAKMPELPDSRQCRDQHQFMEKGGISQKQQVRQRDAAKRGSDCEQLQDGFVIFTVMNDLSRRQGVLNKAGKQR